MVMSSNQTYSQLWQELAPNQPPNCPPMHNYVFNRAFYEGKVGIGGLFPGMGLPCARAYEPQSLLHLHTIYNPETQISLPASMRLQSHIPSMLISERSKFAGSEITFLSGSPQNLSSPWEVGAIATIACGRGSNDEYPASALYEPTPTTDYKGGLLFFNSQPKGSTGLVEVMRMVNNRVGIGFNMPQGTVPVLLNQYVSPAGRFHVLSQIVAGALYPSETAVPEYQGLLTLLPGRDGNWWHIKNDNSTLRIMIGGSTPTTDSDVPAPNPVRHTAMTFQNWNNSVTIGSDIIPLNATCAVYSEPLFNNLPQPITLRIARKRTNGIDGNTNIPGVSGNKDYKLLSAGHEDEENFVIYGNGKTRIGQEAITSGSHANWQLAVDGKIVAKEVVVTLDNWADFVFKKDYALRSLEDVEKFIDDNGHLPDIPNEKEVQSNGGIEIGEMQVRLLQKVEELTLYMIQLKKENDDLKKMIQSHTNPKE
ncbi:MAG: hypothetical protein ACK6BZ_15050 [Candidatus Kapaibacterium sp.]